MPNKSEQIIVTVTDDMLKNIRELADQLATEGMKVDRILPITGVIAGSASADKISALEKLEGVMSIEEEAVADLKA